MKQKAKIQLILGIAAVAYGFFHAFWRNALNSGQFQRGNIAKDEWVINSLQIDLERNLIIGMGVIVLVITIAFVMRRMRKIEFANQAAAGEGDIPQIDFVLEGGDKSKPEAEGSSR